MRILDEFMNNFLKHDYFKKTFLEDELKKIRIYLKSKKETVKETKRQKHVLLFKTKLNKVNFRTFLETGTFFEFANKFEIKNIFCIFRTNFEMEKKTLFGFVNKF